VQSVTATASSSQPPSTLAAADQERIHLRAAAFCLGGVIFLQKFALPGNIELSFIVVVLYCLFTLQLGLARFGLRSVSFILVAFLFAAAASFSAAHNAISVQSIAFAIAVHVPLVLFFPVSKAFYEGLLRIFSSFCLVICALVFFQWAQQLIGMRMINLEDFVPREMLFKTYVYVQKINLYSQYYKPNGFFCLEASNAAQLLAIGAIVELYIFRRLKLFLILTAGSLATLAGTGIFILVLGLLFLPFLAGRRLVMPALALVVLIVLFGTALGLVDYAVGRISEFGEEGTSGNGRFLASYRIILQTIATDLPSFFLGYGPGVVNPALGYLQDVPNPLAKTITDYGIVGSLAFMIWLHAIAFSSRAPLVLVLALLAQYEFVQGGFMVPINTYLLWLLAGAFVAAKTDPVPPAATQDVPSR
jgi:hypothetical protein